MFRRQTDWWAGLVRSKKNLNNSLRVLVKMSPWDQRKWEQKMWNVLEEVAATLMWGWVYSTTETFSPTATKHYIGIHLSDLGGTQGRGGGKITDCGVRGLGSNTDSHMWLWASQSDPWRLSGLSCETGQRIHALTEELCGSNEVMNMKQLCKLKTPYKYLIRNILHCIHI